MFPQPGSQGGGLAVREHVEAAMGDRVDQHGRILMASRDREVIDTEHCHRPHLGSGSACTRRSGVLRAATRPSWTARRDPALPASANPMCSSTVRHTTSLGILGSQPVDLLGERPNRDSCGCRKDPTHL